MRVQEHVGPASQSVNSPLHRRIRPFSQTERPLQGKLTILFTRVGTEQQITVNLRLLRHYEVGSLLRCCIRIRLIGQSNTCVMHIVFIV